MSGVKEMTAKQARDALAAKQEQLGKVFDEARVPGLDGQKQYDFNRVTVLGADVKGSIAVAERVKALNAEADELAKHAETLEAGERAAQEYEEREKGIRRVPHPAKGGAGDHRGATKSLGELVAGEKAYQAWAKQGAGGGITLNFDDALPSDLMAKAASFDTMMSKTLMTTSAGWAPESLRAPGFVEARTRPIQLLDIIPLFAIGQDQYTYMEETTRTHSAAETAEGGDFAESAFALTERTSPVKKITDSVPVTDEQLEDERDRQRHRAIGDRRL